MIQNHRPGAALCIDALSGDANVIGIEIRHTTQRCICIAALAQTDLLSGQPLQRTMGADMVHGIGTEAFF